MLLKAGLIALIALASTWLLAFGISNYSDYRAASETTLWLSAARAMLSELESDVVSGVRIDKSDPRVVRYLGAIATIDQFEIRPSGDLFIRGGRDGQFIYLIAEQNENKITWRCVGGSRHAMPVACK